MFILYVTYLIHIDIFYIYIFKYSVGNFDLFFQYFPSWSEDGLDVICEIDN